MTSLFGTVSQSMEVEIWSDIVCPWCYIGKRRFEAALAGFAHRDEVKVTWRSFELDPNTPQVVETDLATRLAAKYGMSREQAVANQERLTGLAAEEGLAFKFEDARAGNTFDGHRLIHLAAEKGLQDAAKERLMKAYFEEGVRPSDAASLVCLLTEVGVPADESEAVLATDAHADAVRADEALAEQFGISGVPFFVLDRRYGLSGAQPSDVILAALEQAWRESHPPIALTPIGGEAPACEDEACET